MMKYQAILTEQDDVILKTTNLLNPAVFLGTTMEEGDLSHDCVETIEHTYASGTDRTNLWRNRIGNFSRMEAALWKTELAMQDTR